MRLAVFDTETTGLPVHPDADLREQPYIIEWGVAHIERGKIVATYETLIRPPISISAEITKITGLTDEDVKDAPTFAEAFDIVQASLLDVDILLAHNLPFDRSLLEFELLRNGLTLDWPPRMECTAQLYFDEYGKRMKLLEIYALKVGKPLMQTHRALDDVNALCEIVIHEKLWEAFR